MNELLLYTNDAAAAREEVERAGGEIRQVFTPRLFTAAVPEGTALARSSVQPPPDLDEISRMMAEAWASRKMKPAAAAEAIPWDTPGYEPPC